MGKNQDPGSEIRDPGHCCIAERKKKDTVKKGQENMYIIWEVLQIIKSVINVKKITRPAIGRLVDLSSSKNSKKNIDCYCFVTSL